MKWKIPAIGLESEICLRKLVTERSMMFLDLYRHYQNGILPVAGGLLDQPYSYYRAMTIVDQWVKASARTES